MAEIVVQVAGTAERALSSFRGPTARLLDRIGVRLAAIRLAHDQEAQRWAAEARAEMGDETWLKQVAEQPTPEEILEQWRAGSSAA